MKLKEQKNSANLSSYLGTWVNTNDKSKLMKEITFFQSEDSFRMSVQASSESFFQGPWNSASVQYHSYSPESNDIVAFQAQFEMEEMSAFLAINENRGLIIIACFLTFEDADERSDCFVREFFYKD